MSDFYHVILESLLSDVEAGIRIISCENEEPCWQNIFAAQSTLRRAVSDAKEAIRSFEDE